LRNAARVSGNFKKKNIFSAMNRKERIGIITITLVMMLVISLTFLLRQKPPDQSIPEQPFYKQLEALQDTSVDSTLRHGKAKKEHGRKRNRQRGKPSSLKKQTSRPDRPRSPLDEPV